MRPLWEGGQTRAPFFFRDAVSQPGFVTEPTGFRVQLGVSSGCRTPALLSTSRSPLSRLVIGSRPHVGHGFSFFQTSRALDCISCPTRIESVLFGGADFVYPFPPPLASATFSLGQEVPVALPGKKPWNKLAPRRSPRRRARTLGPVLFSLCRGRRASPSLLSVP